MTEYHVAKSGSDQAPGTADAPFGTINRAAQAAMPGDDVVVHAGIYREWVSPSRGGTSDTRRITYRAAQGEHVVIKGSEQVTDWVREPLPDQLVGSPFAVGGVWRLAVPNSLFGDFNPYERAIGGDWLVRPTEADGLKHLGEVYLDGKSFFEVSSRQAVFSPGRRDVVSDDWTGLAEEAAGPDQAPRVWHAEVGPTDTVIWANFGAADPNLDTVEINVRRCVFYPRETGRDYITVRGFELAQAACPWAPPTAEQPGLIGPNWAKGWVIEDNVIHDAKCAGISIGKEASTGDNFFTQRRDKPGYQYQLEAVFAARAIGWSKERIGSHVIRRNTIFDCGQNGIVGHLGCVFSEIYDNHIYNIALKREFYGHEIAGIKLHAAIDVSIKHNRIHNCSLGTWLDWQTQGTRVTANTYYQNNRDLFIEVSHGPYVVDHNIFASKASIELFSQGGAFVGNLVAGTVRVESVKDRATPYHVPHSTEVAGYAVVHGGDDRWIGNVFGCLGSTCQDITHAYGPEVGPGCNAAYGTVLYSGHPASFEAYLATVDAALPGDLEAVIGLKQPVYIRHNLYLGGAAPYPDEEGAVVAAGALAIAVSEELDRVSLVVDLPEEFGRCRAPVQSTRTLPPVRLAAAAFENPDGSELVFDQDLLGTRVTANASPGPIVSLRPGANRVLVWQAAHRPDRGPYEGQSQRQADARAAVMPG
ncbi:MAG: right-handed parallel beta-helix repeat-containing protein [Bifidobacteriaceae bacterium]|nr:right-handed parallel beta-helix repeat-containing protein [Bifidobacteriaceae bacterium]